MAGSGRGRGRAAFTFNIEAIGFVKGETLPEAVLRPCPLYPTTSFKPLPLKMGEDEDYLMALKQELRQSMRRTPYFMPAKDKNQGVEKYSKKYLKINEKDLEWTPDWRRLPREIKPTKKVKKVHDINCCHKSEFTCDVCSGEGQLCDYAGIESCHVNVHMTIQRTLVAGEKPKKAKAAASLTNVDVLKKIEELEKKGDEEKSDEEKEKEKEKDKEEGEEEPEEYDEEEHDEENDYISSYFEDGDDYGAGSDENMDEATY